MTVPNPQMPDVPGDSLPPAHPLWIARRWLASAPVRGLAGFFRAARGGSGSVYDPVVERALWGRSRLLALLVFTGLYLSFEFFSIVSGIFITGQLNRGGALAAVPDQAMFWLLWLLGIPLALLSTWALAGYWGAWRLRRFFASGFYRSELALAPGIREGLLGAFAANLIRATWILFFFTRIVSPAISLADYHIRNDTPLPFPWYHLFLGPQSQLAPVWAWILDAVLWKAGDWFALAFNLSLLIAIFLRARNPGRAVWTAIAALVTLQILSMILMRLRWWLITLLEERFGEIAASGVWASGLTLLLYALAFGWIWSRISRRFLAAPLPCEGAE